MHTARLVYKGEVSYMEFDRIPIVNEIIMFDENNWVIVKEVFWRLDGHASLLVSDKEG